MAASPADQKAIEALIPKNITDPAQLPRTIPASISLKPQILVDGQVKAEGTGLSAGSEPIGVGAFTQYGTGQWDQTQDQLVAGQQTALGLSIQGIGQAQIDTLKSRIEQTKSTLERAQKAPESQRADILKNITGDQLTGDLLTATIWGYFASLQSHGFVVRSQAQMFDVPALSYGLFHIQVKPNELYGTVTTGITFQGLNVDVGHVRSIRWVKDDNPQSAINNQPELIKNGKSAAQNRWITCNKMRGQYASAMEYVVPEQFWVDKTNCSYQAETEQIQNPSLPVCPQAISAVKAIAIAQAEGQKIYTITRENVQTALPKLPVGGDVGAEIRSAIQAGKEVTVHEKPINAYGWTGYGYIIVDPETGVGAYLIEGGWNGGTLLFQAMAALLALISMISFANLASWIKILPKILAINPFIRLAVAFLAFVGMMMSDDPWEQNETALNLKVITTLVSFGLMAAAVSPVLFAIPYIALVVFVGYLVGRLGMLLFAKNSPKFIYI